MTAQGTAQGSWSQLESEQGHDTLGWTGQEHLVHKGPKRTTIKERSCLHQQRATVSAPSPFNRINTYLLIYFVRCLENYLSPRQLSLGPHEIMDNCSLLCCPLQYFCWLWTHQNPCHMGRKHKVTLHGEKGHRIRCLMDLGSPWFGWLTGDKRQIIFLSLGFLIWYRGYKKSLSVFHRLLCQANKITDVKSTF